MFIITNRVIDRSASGYRVDIKPFSSHAFGRNHSNKDNGKGSMDTDQTKNNRK